MAVEPNFLLHITHENGFSLVDDGLVVVCIALGVRSLLTSSMAVVTIYWFVFD